MKVFQQIISCHGLLLPLVADASLLTVAEPDVILLVPRLGTVSDLLIQIRSGRIVVETHHTRRPCSS